MNGPRGLSFIVDDDVSPLYTNKFFLNKIINCIFSNSVFIETLKVKEI